MGVLLPVCGVGSVFLSSVFSLVMTKQWEGAHQLSWALCIERLKTDKQAAMIALVAFFMIYAIVAMLIFTMGDGKTTYKSELREITDQISTPVPCGENQHGSAEWMKKSEYAEKLGSALLPLKKGMLPELMSKGKADLAFIVKPRKKKEGDISFENDEETDKQEDSESDE